MKPDIHYEVESHLHETIFFIYDTLEIRNVLYMHIGW